jgi:uncharacterized protein (TIGR02270 family)
MARPICWDICAEHLDEAAWLWGTWEGSLDSAVYVLSEVVAGPEENLLAHLDGLVQGGLPVAEKLLLPALGGDDPGAMAAAAWALVQAEDADHQDVVIDTLASAKPPARAAIARAMSLSPRADLSRLVPLWNTGAPPVRAAVLDVFGPREPDWVRERINPALRSGEAPVIAAGLRAIHRLRDRAFLDQVQVALQSGDPEVRREAITTGIALGSRAAWSVCRLAGRDPGEACRLPLALLAMSPDPNDRALAREKTKDPVATRHALWALGFAVDLESAELLIQALADEKAAPIAAEAFSAITGLAIAGELVEISETKGANLKEVENDDPPPVVRSEDSLPVPQVQALIDWWNKERPRFRPGMRYLYGEPRHAQSLRAALTAAPTWRREVLWLELETMAGNAPSVDLKGWARDQQGQLGHGR